MEIYIENLTNKKNNNDFLLQSLLKLKFELKSKKLENVISLSCDFLSKENSLNNMCDFKDNKCVDCRERNIDRSIGCCQKNCKFTHTGVCEVKNISCKLYMCDNLENRGFYFSSQNLPILKLYLSPIQRFVCICMLFRSLDFQVKCLKWVQLGTILLFILIFLFILFNSFDIFLNLF